MDSPRVYTGLAIRQVALCKISYLNPIEGHFLSSSSKSQSLPIIFHIASALMHIIWLHCEIFELNLLFCYRGTSVSFLLIASLCPCPRSHLSITQVLCLCSYLLFLLLHPYLNFYWIFQFSVKKKVLCSPTSMKTECPIFPWPHTLLLSLLFGCWAYPAECWSASARKSCQMLAWWHMGTSNIWDKIYYLYNKQ